MVKYLSQNYTSKGHSETVKLCECENLVVVSTELSNQFEITKYETIKWTNQKALYNPAAANEHAENTAADRRGGRRRIVSWNQELENKPLSKREDHTEDHKKAWSHLWHKGRRTVRCWPDRAAERWRTVADGRQSFGRYKCWESPTSHICNDLHWKICIKMDFFKTQLDYDYSDQESFPKSKSIYEK